MSNNNSKEKQKKDGYELKNIDDCTTLFEMEALIFEEKEKEDSKMLEKKRKRNINQADIEYDADKKELRNCFCPNIDEMNEFLEKSEIREIKDIHEIKNLKLSNDDIFDPETFINNNYKENGHKICISPEDISSSDKEDNIEDNDLESFQEEENIIEDKNLENLAKEKEKYSIPESIKNKNDIIKNILNNEILTVEQKEQLNELILKIKKMDIKTIIKKKK